MAINQDRVAAVARLVVINSGIDWEDVNPIQRFLLMEQALAYETAHHQYNAEYNIVEAEVSDSIFGIEEDNASSD